MTEGDRNECCCAPGFLRRRLIPAPLPDTSSLGRKAGAQWVDVPPLGLKEPFEIKVYEIDDVERLQRRREVVTGSEVRPASCSVIII